MAKPEIKIGDRWIYRRTDVLTNKVQQDYETNTVFIGPDVILTTAKRTNSEELRDENYTSEWNARSTGAGFVFNPIRRFLKFPLTVGDSFNIQYELVGVRGSSARTQLHQDVKVVGWEDLIVPAGKFRAIRIETKGSFQRLDKFATGNISITYWYVPEVKRWARWAWDDGTVKVIDELVEYRVQ